ncbi:protein tyrosine kinase domain-containing protein [Rhizoctonia solani AG-1 IA]|uniref:Protein tyrosine kinase domain-containing protein n=1 Tax=Thanatephorus cucumeris (strain AG1-IA) TaxID=983506 RepID=L8WNJ5_THACA|nr:protein tyrosine kinase domain-containing protein [Rhizoctonia solani AG-1 IA]
MLVSDYWQISPPAYEHVWKDIYMANSAAYRLRTAITKSYPQAIAARFLLHEHLAVTANAVSGAGLFPPAPGTTISSSTVPATPALTAASVSTPGSVFTSLPGFSGTTDPDFPTTALKSAHANLKEAFLLYSEQFDLRKEYFGRALVLEYRERGGSRSGVSSRDDSRERPDRGFSGGFVMPPGPRTPGGYGYEEPRNNYGYPKPGDFVRPGLGHRDSAASCKSAFGRQGNNADRLLSAKTVGTEVMLVTNGDNGEDEAMLNEDSLLCLVEDVDGACDALGEYAPIPDDDMIESGNVQDAAAASEGVAEVPDILHVMLKSGRKTNLTCYERIIRNILVRLSRIQPNDGVGRISDSIDQLSTNLVEFARGQGFEIYNGVSPSPVDPVPPMRELNNSSPKPPPPAAPLYSNPGGSGFTERERSYAPVPERMYSNPNSTFSPPVKSASPAPTASSSHYRPANQSPGPYVNPNRLNDMTGSQTPYSGSSSQGATPNMGSMPLVRRTDPVEVLSDPNGLEELARKGLDAVDGFMQVLRQLQDIATGHPESSRFREALVYLWRVTGHYPAERDITNEISRVGKTPVGQDAVSFTHCVMPRHGAFGLVMPVAGRGNVIQYLLANPGADRTEIVLQAAEGLRFLHEEAKGVNLVVSEDDRVMVTGYGILTAIEKNQELGFPEWGLHWGDGRWMAPELHHYLNPKTRFPGQRTTQSDVYIWTSAAPFAGQSDSNVVLEVANKGRIPPRPTNTVFISKSRSDQVWGLLQACWNLNPGVRPNMRTVVETLSSLAE